MDDDQNNEGNGIVAWILGIAVTIAIAVSVIPAVIVAMNATPAASAPAAANAPAPAAALQSIAPVKFYFETGKTELPASAHSELEALIAAVREGKVARLAISGFHDKTGDPVQNAELAKNRAKMVKEVLVASGLTETQVEMRKPEETTGGADDREARRVEVSAQN